MLEKVQLSTDKLLGWFEKNGTKGYDPYDIKGFNDYTLNLWTFFSELKWHEVFSRLFLLDFADTYIPLITRKAFGIKKLDHPTVHGLMLCSFINLYHSNGNEEFIVKAKFHANWLKENSIPNITGLAWGTPFRWKSGNKIFGSETALTVVGAWCGEGFFQLYKATGNASYLEDCAKIAETMIQTIGFQRLNENEICFSYSNAKKDYVLNASLFAAEFILKVAKETGNAEWIQLADQATNYILRNQNPDGSLYYFGSEQNSPTENDVYHSGYEIRMLYRIYLLTNRNDVLSAAKKYYEYFLNSYFDAESIKLKKSKKYPIDITGCAEAIVTMVECKNLHPETDKYLNRHLNYVFSTFQDKKGYFYYRILKTKIMIKIPYVRWSEAWMLYALTSYLKRHE